MTVATFDTLKYANTLKAAGVPEKQAEAQATILAEALAVNLKDLVTKDDLHESEQRVNARIDLVRSDINGKMDSLDAKSSGRFMLLYWMLGFLLALGVLAAVRPLLFPIR